MGSAFAKSAGLVFQILSLAFMLNSVAQLPFTLLQAVGRSDLTGKIHLVELPIHFLFTFIAIRYLGLVGAATATLFRIIIDMVLLYTTTSRRLGLKIGLSKESWRSFGTPGLCLTVGMICTLVLQREFAVKMVFAFASFLLYVFVVLRFSLKEDEKKLLLNVVRRKTDA